MSLAEQAAELLLEARTERAPLESFPSDLEPKDLETAYAIQEASLEGILESMGGGSVIGYKIGCTSDAAKELLGLDSPFVGRLLSPQQHSSPAQLDAASFTIRVIEPEIAYRLGSDLPASGGPYDAANIEGAVAGVRGSIEIVDTRYEDWTGAGGLRLIADNGSAGAWVAGAESSSLDVADPVNQAITMTQYREDALFAAQEGQTGATLGSSLNALAWLANELNRQGHELRAGDLVSTGTTTPVLHAQAGDRVIADFGPLGTVTVDFT